MSKQNLNLKASVRKLIGHTQRLRGYSFLAFLVFIILLYGFVLLRINTLSTGAPSSTAISGGSGGGNVPRIDESVVKQLKSLQDNSVSVKALFDDARNNPFQ